jgi:putative nucleotidyltransferase with HDIG domain
MKFHSTQFFDRIVSSKHLPSLPHILVKLMDLCNKEDTQLSDFSQIIKSDSALLATFLRVVSSTNNKMPARIANIEQALEFLGTDTIKNIAISTSVYQVFEKARVKSFFILKRFWWHSLMCAFISEHIAKNTLYPSPDEAFLSGLLHDIGKLILLVNFQKEYEEIIHVSDDRPELLRAEETRLGATHAEVGAWMINQWNLQPFISDAVLYHHESVERILDAFPLVKIVYVANTLSSVPINKSEISSEIAKQVLGLSPTEVEEITSEAEFKVNQIAQSLEITIEPPGAPEKDLYRDNEKQKELVRKLSRKLRDISLLQGTLQDLLKAYNEDTIFTVVQQGFRVFLDLRNILFFLYDPEKDMLIGKVHHGKELADLINETTIPLQKKNSLLVRSLLQETPLDSFNHQKKAVLPIIDEQIIRLTRKEGILCLPMVSKKQYIGVIVIGIDETQRSQVYEQVTFLTMIANQAAIALHTDYLRQRQVQSIESQRLTASSIIARKVVHEVNTPLNIIKNYLKILENKTSRENLGQEELRIIHEEIDRVALIVGELAHFSEPKSRPTDRVDINALVSEVIKIIKESFLSGSNINVHLKIDPSLPRLIMNKNSLKQALMNLIQNAIDALLEGGNIYIATRYTTEHPGATLPLDVRSDLGYAEITISDDGPGIPDTIKPHLFGPSATTKRGEHAGLGLYIVNNIVKELKGTISCMSDKNKGTSFKIVLPIVNNRTS